MRRGLNLLLLLGILCCIPIFSYGQDTKPIARFYFEKTSYQENEPISAIDESYSPVGKEIVKREWKIILNGKEKKSSNLTSLLSNVKVGQVTVYLRVRDKSGIWSEWTSRNIIIKKAEPFTITSFKSEQTTYGIGEKLQLTYTYNNPNDLDIKSQRWRYRNLSTNGRLVSSKPRYFKKTGLYEITLELQDEWGNWSNKVTCKVNISNEVIDRNGYYLFEKGKQGDLIDGYVDKDYNSFTEANIVSVVDMPGTLIMSNSPESLYSSGILYKETSTGVGRLLVHHQNRTQYAKKLLVLVTNPGQENVTLKISNKAIAGPNRHILQTGQKAVTAYLNGTAAQNYTIKPGETICLYDSSNIKSWKAEEVVSGTLDFDSSGTINWQVVAMDEKSGLDNLSKLKVLDRDVHNRGTFNVIERQYVLDLNNIQEATKLVLGREKEEWLEGTDALTGDTMWNKGNYGLPIKIVIQNNEDMGIIANARGGNILGTLKWNKSKIFNIPNEGILNSQTVAALVGTVQANTENEIVYMLPNGSSAPILFGFIPKSQWK